MRLQVAKFTTPSSTTPSSYEPARREPDDHGQVALARHFRVRVEPVGKYRSRVRILDGCVLDGLLLDGVITLGEHDAGRRFAEDCLSARILGVPCSNPERSTFSTGSQISDTQCAALSKIGMAVKEILRFGGGPSGERMLWAVVIGDGTPRTLIEVRELREALRALVGFYERWFGVRRERISQGVIRSMFFRPQAEASG